jgi:N-carbamoyl-L-amino-acid hydrolase
LKSQPLIIDSKRLRTDIDELAGIGRAQDHGIYRMAFSDADMAARAWLRKRIEEAGLDFLQDGAGNLFGRLNWNDGIPSVMTGSHIDTVPGAGHLDGALGVLTGLEALRVLKERGVPLERPLELVAFSDEEGRFGGMFGSQAISGNISPEWIHTARDLSNEGLVQVMARQGLDAADALTAARAPATLHAFVEMHIEQGPVLDATGASIGVVEGICGLRRWEVRFSGIANHAGATPMSMRVDAFQGLVAFSSEIETLLDDRGGDLSVATIGRVELSPGVANVVPGEVLFTFEFRDMDETVLDNLSDAFQQALSSIARRQGLMFSYEVLSQLEAIACNDHIQRIIGATALELGHGIHPMPSGAAHDTQQLARITRTGMIFVPSKGGRSHSAAEWTDWNDIKAGANVLLNTLYKLANE